MVKGKGLQTFFYSLVCSVSIIVNSIANYVLGDCTVRHTLYTVPFRSQCFNEKFFCVATTISSLLGCKQKHAISSNVSCNSSSSGNKLSILLCVCVKCGG